MFQGLKELRERNWQEPPFDPRSLDAVLITHEHIDHTGYLPRLVRQGFHGPIYCSRGTADLLKILLPDAGRLQEEDADYKNRHNLTKHVPALPLYTEKDADASLELIKPVSNLGERFQVAPGIHASFSISGHILGSSLVLVEIDGAGDDRQCGRSGRGEARRSGDQEGQEGHRQAEEGLQALHDQGQQEVRQGQADRQGPLRQDAALRARAPGLKPSGSFLLAPLCPHRERRPAHFTQFRTLSGTLPIRRV